LRQPTGGGGRAQEPSRRCRVYGVCGGAGPRARSRPCAVVGNIEGGEDDGVGVFGRTRRRGRGRMGRKTEWSLGG
jgi:hypothetical protein